MLGRDLVFDDEKEVLGEMGARAPARVDLEPRSALPTDPKR